MARRCLAASSPSSSLSVLVAAAEKPPEEDRYRQKISKAKARLRLKSFWLAYLYKNLSFSPRALQNLMEVQDVPDVFPSLPDALAHLNLACIASDVTVLGDPEVRVEI